MSENYHLCVHTYHRRVTIHAPTEAWEHLPREQNADTSYWVGPFRSEADAAGVAGDLAETNDYEKWFCKVCFPEKYPPPPTRGDAPAGPKRRRNRRLSYTPRQADNQRKSRRGV